MNDSVLNGEFIMPSLGKIYGREVNPNVRFRSMTVAEEQKRLNSSDRPYKNLAEIMDDCLIEDPGISCYDMCLGDFQFLLHRLRVVTYGSSYGIVNKCPYCGYENTGEIDLLDIPVSYYTEDLDKYLEVTLPVTKHTIKINMQTPRILDDINLEAKRIASKKKSSVKESAFLLNIESLIGQVDGEKPSPSQLDELVTTMPMADVNYLLAAAERLNSSIGIDVQLSNVCDCCGMSYDTPFRTTPEFFRPTIDI